MQQQIENKKTLDWITARVRDGIREYRLPLRLIKMFIQLARGCDSPSSTFDMAVPIVRAETRFVSLPEASEISQIARWLAVAKRDYGETAFETLAKSIT